MAALEGQQSGHDADSGLLSDGDDPQNEAPEVLRSGQSEWNLFDCSVEVVRLPANEGSETSAYKILTYWCAGRPVQFRKPIEGAGTNLMHGDFARRVSPSEEALTMYLLKHHRASDGRRVLVLGAGLGLAGLAVAICTRALCVELTDGDPEVIQTLTASVQLNQERFGDTEVLLRKRLWDNRAEWPERGTFDTVIGADVVYLEQFHTALLSMVQHSLRPGGLFLLIASRRNGSLAKFVASAKGFFPGLAAFDDYDTDVSKAIRRSAKCFPIMVRCKAPDEEAELPQSVVNLCDEMAERRAAALRKAEAEVKHKECEKERMRKWNEKLAQRRKLRLEEEASRPVSEPMEVAEKSVKTRAPTLSRSEQEGRSEWGLFEVQVTISKDAAFKDMAFDVRGRSLCIRKPLVGNFSHGDFARRISPSAEVLAWYVVKLRSRFKKKRVLELGAGMGLSGLAACVGTAAKHIELTDGDPNSVSLLEENMSRNKDAFTAKKVTARPLVWGEGLDGFKPVDWILAADIVYLEDSHAAILGTLRRLLKPSGTALFTASPCASSLDAFVRKASIDFDQVEVSRDYDPEVSKCFHGMKCFPHLVRLRRSTHPSAPAARRSVRANAMVVSATQATSQPEVGNSEVPTSLTPVAQARALAPPKSLPQTRSPRPQPAIHAASASAATLTDVETSVSDAMRASTPPPGLRPRRDGRPPLPAHGSHRSQTRASGGESTSGFVSRRQSPPAEADFASASSTPSSLTGTVVTHSSAMSARSLLQPQMLPQMRTRLPSISLRSSRSAPAVGISFGLAQVGPTSAAWTGSPPCDMVTPGPRVPSPASPVLVVQGRPVLRKAGCPVPAHCKASANMTRCVSLPPALGFRRAVCL